MELRTLESRPVLIDQVYERLVDAISIGSLPPGQRLRQEKLAADLGVSRQPVSHALAMLKSSGLAVEQGVRGLVVAPIDPERLYHLYEVRAVMEGLSARLAAQRVAADPTLDLSALGEALAKGAAAEQAGDIPAAVDWDLSFHSAINALSGNPVLTEVSDGQRPQIRRVMAVVKNDRSLATRIWDEHTAIADAIRGGDAATAETLAREHAARAGEETRRRLISKARSANTA
ncbi:GntR family transcriptional regulator [Thalassobaculum sp.]|uniref:GntR family transcriptional regulator n=1 Tax=Thalassobaculum sp. TaxID=2022740 RepID=UPI0032ED5D70